MGNSFFGKNGFIWWKGVVEDRKDPIFLGRVRVRIFGWHTEDKTELPTEDLPWAMPSLPIDNGKNPVGLKEGDWCWGFFLDDTEAQKPIVVGFIPGIDEDPANPSTGFYDPTPDDELTSENVPRPPRMSPIKDYEAEFLETGADGFDPNRLPQDNVAFGQLTSEYSADRFKYDLNQDGTFDQTDIDQMVTEGEIFTGEVDTVADAQQSDISRYPLEDSLNEPSSSRLARNENITQTIVASKISSVTAGEGAGYDGNVLGAEEQPAFPFAEPKTPYNAKYPYNHVYESESGHVIEVDDTPGAERLHWYHRSGSFKEIHPSGLEVNKSVNHQYNFAYLDHYCGVGYNYNLDAGENIRIKSGLAFNINSGSDLNRQVGGSMNSTVASDKNTKVTGNENTLVSTNSNEVISKNKNVIVTEKGNIIAKVVNVNGEDTINIFSGKKITITSTESLEIACPNVQIIGNVNITGGLGATETANVVAELANAIKLPGSIVSIDTVPKSPSAKSVNEAESLKTADETIKEVLEKTSAAEGSPKYGYLIPNGVAGDVWKPISEGDGNLVVLSSLGGSHELREAVPTAQLESVLIKHKSISGKITEWEVVRPIHVPGELIASPYKIDNFIDGVRKLARFNEPGGKYPKQLFWMNNGVPILILDSGYRHQCESPYNNKINFDLTTVREVGEDEEVEEE